MGAARTPAATVPEELKRQSDRIIEQLTQLYKILDTTTSHLGEMSQMMENYSPDLVAQINKLKSALESYRGKAGTIYGEVSDSLAIYASSLVQNLENLSTSVSEISNTIELL